MSCSSEFEIKESEVPKDILNVFKAKYPAVTVEKWEAEREKGNFYFEADRRKKGLLKLFSG